AAGRVRRRPRERGPAHRLRRRDPRLHRRATRPRRARGGRRGAAALLAELRARRGAAPHGRLRDLGPRGAEAQAELTGRLVLGQGTRLFPDASPDIALDLVDSRADSKGVTIQVYRPTGRPRYATATADHDDE